VVVLGANLVEVGVEVGVVKVGREEVEGVGAGEAMGVTVEAVGALALVVWVVAWGWEVAWVVVVDVAAVVVEAEGACLARKEVVAVAGGLKGPHWWLQVRQGSGKEVRCKLVQCRVTRKGTWCARPEESLGASMAWQMHDRWTCLSCSTRLALVIQSALFSFTSSHSLLFQRATVLCSEALHNVHAPVETLSEQCDSALPLASIDGASLLGVEWCCDCLLCHCYHN
jgi:hypothetical protein